MTESMLFDRPTALVTLTGPDAPQFLHNICTNDITALPVGGGCEAYLCGPTAKALFVLWVTRGEARLWVTTTPGRVPDLVRYLDRFLISERVELRDESGRYRTAHVAGPAAAELLAVDELPPFAVSPAHDPEQVFVRRHDVLGRPGYDVFVAADSGEGVFGALRDTADAIGTPELWETMRIEAGTPVYDVDFDDTRFVMEVGGAARAVSYTKGCFPGQEPIVMARDRAGRVNRQFLGLKGLTEAVPAPGAKLTRDGKEVGLVTSATVSPRLGAPLALGYVHWQHVERGTRLDAGGVPVEVLGYPPLTAAGDGPAGVSPKR